MEKTQEATKAPSKALQELFKLQNTPEFNPLVVDEASLDQMISAHQLKYIEFLMQADEERKLAVENLQDFKTKYSLEIQERALEHAEKAMYDPDYFTRNKIDPEFAMPIQIVGVIKSKKEEAKQKTWKLEYHARLVNRLRQFKNITRMENPEPKKPFWKKLFN